jgi:hypothetical protein
MRVICGAVDKRGLAAAQKLHAHEIKARRVDHTAIVSNLPPVVEHGDVQP